MTLLALGACAGEGGPTKRINGSDVKSILPGQQPGIPGAISTNAPPVSPTPALSPTPSISAAAPTPSVSPGVVSDPGKCRDGKFTIVSFGQSCPANSAVYGVDDSNTSVFACCSLPATDILLATSAPVVRTGECANDEVMVGAGASSSQLLCQKIDVTKYQLGPTNSASCYHNSCGIPGALDVTLMNSGRFGLDLCASIPGYLIHGKSGSTCDKVSTRAFKTISGASVAFP